MGMLHQGQRLPFGFKPGQDLPGVHALLDDLDCHTAWIGSVCSAIHTVPMPPSPIGSSSLYGPMTVPRPS